MRGAAGVVGAAEVALIRSTSGDLTVLAVSADGQSHRTPGEIIAARDAQSLGYVVASGQPLSIGAQRPHSGAADQTPAGAVMCVPCIGTRGVVGAMEIRAELNDHGFAPEASRLASLFADVAGALLEEDEGGAATPSPSELGSELGVLARADPARYAAIASALEALLAYG